MSSVGRRMAGGAVWMVLLRGSEKILGIVSTIILARLLVPADFGMIAMAMSLVAIVELIRAFGFEAALIQKSDADRAYYDTAWTLNVVLGFLVATLLIALAYPAAAFYEDQRLVALICFLAFGQALQGFENVGAVAFQKDLRFGMEFAYQISRKFAGFIVTIPLAFLLRNYWALAAGMVAGRVVALAISYIAHPFRPRLSLAMQGELLHFSKWLLLNNFLFAMQMRSQDFVIGKFAGASGLGLYNVSYEVSTLPTTGIVAPINRAVFPGFAKLAAVPGALVSGYLRVLGMIALFAFPAGLGIAATADLLIPTVLGDKWLSAIPIVQILAVYGALAALGSVFSPAFMAMGRPRVLAVFTAINVSLFIPLVVFGTLKAGVIGASWGCLAVVSVMMPASHWLAARSLGIPLLRVVAVFWRPALAAIAMYTTVVALVALLGNSGSSLVLLPRLLMAVAAGVAVFSVVMFALWYVAGRPEGAEQTLLGELTARISKRQQMRLPRKGNSC